ncbi:MAG TPA: stage III sporulation protein AH [Ruminiclostridium sp.]|jgi:stage III sporulation protein AH|nr:stage III sporulation protein AH [Ruminiclostridium sp.]
MKRKQIIVLGLVLVIITVGILQYNYGGVGESSRENLDGLIQSEKTNLENIPGAAVYVDGDLPDAADAAAAGDQQASGYFAEARMQRDKSRSKEKEELQNMAQGISGEVEASSILTSEEVQTQLMAVIKRSEAETTIETLIKQRGFEDALAYMSDTGNIDVVVKAASLSEKEVAQISDIVVRHADVDMENITVKNVN